MRGKKTGKQQHQQQKTTVPRPFPHMLADMSWNKLGSSTAKVKRPLSLWPSPQTWKAVLSPAVFQLFCVCVWVWSWLIWERICRLLCCLPEGSFEAEPHWIFFKLSQLGPATWNEPQKINVRKKNFPWSWEWKKEPCDVDLEETTQLLGAGYNWT